MAEITAAAVKALRDRTQLPMMKCKKALQEANGDQDAAVEALRKEGEKFNESRGDRETSAGRVEIFADMSASAGAIIELQCESDPVAKNDEVRQLCRDLATQLATGPGAASAQELLAQNNPSKSGETLQDTLNDITNRIREVFRLSRIQRLEGSCGGYAHHTGSTGVLVQVEGGNAEAGKDVAMHIAAMKPQVVSKEDLPADEVAREREILLEAARKEGKPENILEKMVEGRLRTFYEQRVLNEQKFVKDETLTVTKFLGNNGMKVNAFVCWELGRD
ncbi:MAG: translation elongation factor Ts [Pirellulales bacterium]|nr:translation elongation factor Ts [Pirellulales bacterium]